MRLATLRLPAGGTVAARQDQDDWRHLPFPDVTALLLAGALVEAADLAPTGSTRLQQARYAPLLQPPRALLCVGLNYRSHITEMGRDNPPHPTIFAKLPQAVVGADDDIALPGNVAHLDWEAELAAVLGQHLHDATPQASLAAVAGYTVANDVTARDWQAHSTQWTLSKSLPGSTPLGPALVTPDECDHARNLHITCSVNGRLQQQARTDDLLHSVGDILSYISQLVPLVPGDVVLTGTPAGVGAAQDPPRRLTAGDVVVTAIEGLGACTNTIVNSRTQQAAGPPG